MTKAVTTKNTTQLSAESLARRERYAGAGTSQAAEDNLVPLIYILQKQSPQVEERDPRYVTDAKAGDIWLRNAPQPIIKGAEGMVFMPCFFSIDWIEWVPRERGGGFVARHASGPDPRKCPVADATKLEDAQNPNRIKYVRPNGNEVIQTRNHIGYVLNDGEQPLPFVIPMFSTGHTTSRNWMTLMNTKLLPSGKIAPSWDYCYRLRTRQRTNQMGTWYAFDVADERQTTDDEFTIGEGLHNAFQAGTQRAEAPMAQEGTVHTEEGPM